MEHTSKKRAVKEASSLQLERAFDMVELLARAGQPLSLGDIAAKISAPKATVHRLLATLVGRGYVAQNVQSGQYMVGLRCFELGSQWAEAQDVRTVALPALRTLNDVALETVHLAIYDHGDAVYIEKLESPQPIVARSFVGGRCPAFCVATGRALLAHQPSAEIARVLAGPLPRFTAASITDPKKLDQLLASIRNDGFAVNHNSYRDGVGGVAVPIRDHTGMTVAAVGLCVPESRFVRERQAGLRKATFAAAQTISTQLGFPGRLVGSPVDVHAAFVTPAARKAYPSPRSLT